MRFAMKNLLFAGLLLIGLAACSTADFVSPTGACTATATINPAYSKATQLENILQKYTAQGIPGATVALYSPAEGYWAGAAGLAKIEDRTPMQICHLQYGQSVTKTYLAVAMLQLYQAGRLDLDAPITNYLPVSVSSKLRDANQITARMLLNHTSGLPEYTDNPTYLAALLQHPEQSYTTAEYLDFIANKPLDFSPGSRYGYRNTNYEVLALIADQIHGSHVRLIQDGILTPLGLQQTFYHSSPQYLQSPDVVNTYLERFGNGRLENVSRMQQVSVQSMFGDDGMVATPLDYVKFLQGLFEGRLLQPASLQLMMTWVNDSSNKPTYGMGLFHSEYKGQVLYGHSGGGIGAGCTLYYLPSKRIFVFMSTNVGTLTDGKIVHKVIDLRDELWDALLQ